MWIEANDNFDRDLAHWFVVNEGELFATDWSGAGEARYRAVPLCRPSQAYAPMVSLVLLRKTDPPTEQKCPDCLRLIAARRRGRRKR